MTINLIAITLAYSGCKNTKNFLLNALFYCFFMY